MNNNNNTLPESFKGVIASFINDLSTTFPEYKYLWKKWTEQTEENTQEIFNFMMKVFPERFFDILTQNDKIFDKESEINTVFLPNVDFKILFNLEGITENTKSAIWKYLQLVMMTLFSSINSKEQFGSDNINIFEGIDPAFLQEKLTETIERMSSFISTTEEGGAAGDDCETSAPSSSCGGGGSTDKKPNLPNPEQLFSHLQNLFNGKIGSLAKELAEEFSKDFTDIISEEDIKQMKDPKIILNKLMNNPQKIMGLVKSLQTRITSKMESGEINKDDIMRETNDMMNKMKEMGGVDQFSDMLKNMAKGMGMGNNVKIDKNALKRMETQMATRERIKKKLDEKRAKGDLVLNEKTNEYVYSGGGGCAADGETLEEKQEKTSLEDIDNLMKSFEDVGIKMKKKKFKKVLKSKINV